MKGDRSGTFWPFWHLMKGLIAEDRAPTMVVLENVCGTLTSHGGKDFATICTALQDGGYALGAMVIDASLFVPQSRPRLLVICSRTGVRIPHQCVNDLPIAPWHTRIISAHAKLPARPRGTGSGGPPLPPRRTQVFADIIEEEPVDVEWFSREKTTELLALMSEINRAKPAGEARGTPNCGWTLPAH